MNADAVKAAAEALDSTGLLGCGCCATYPPEKCACGTTDAELNWDQCPTCGEFASSDYDRGRMLSEAAVAAAEPIIRAAIAAEMEQAGRDEVAWLSQHATDAIDRARVIGTEDAWKAAIRNVKGDTHA